MCVFVARLKTKLQIFVQTNAKSIQRECSEWTCDTTELIENRKEMKKRKNKRRERGLDHIVTSPLNRIFWQMCQHFTTIRKHRMLYEDIMRCTWKGELKELVHSILNEKKIEKFLFICNILERNCSVSSKCALCFMLKMKNIVCVCLKWCNKNIATNRCSLYRIGYRHHWNDIFLSNNKK